MASTLVFARLLTGLLLAFALFLGLAAAGSRPETASAYHGAGAGKSFLFLQAGFTQEIFGVSAHGMGGVAFAPDGDPWVKDCGVGPGPTGQTPPALLDMHRYDVQGTAPTVNGTQLHPASIVPSIGGCGITNHPDGRLYVNGGNAGVRVLDASTGALIRTIGPPGNALGIAVDPQTNHVIYVHENCRSSGACTIVDLDPVSGTSRSFASLSGANATFVDGIYFDSSGTFLFMANRQPVPRLTILSRTGGVVQHVPMTSVPDGVAFKATTPIFVLTSNLNGTLTRFDFPSNDFTRPPMQTVFASGGHRGDLSQVGSDGCLYATQNGTRYDNGVVTGENSLVRICGGFAAPPGVGLNGRMTGGGTVKATGVSATHGFVLYCDTEEAPNNLEVNWDQGKKFHLERLLTASCSDDPSIDPKPPTAPFDTYSGSGSGRFNGASGATAQWTFTDAGEPGKNDLASIVIKDASGTVVLSIAGKLDKGDHQTHRLASPIASPVGSPVGSPQALGSEPVTLMALAMVGSLMLYRRGVRLG